MNEKNIHNILNIKVGHISLQLNVFFIIVFFVCFGCGTYYPYKANDISVVYDLLCRPSFHLFRIIYI